MVALLHALRRRSGRPLARHQLFRATQRVARPFARFLSLTVWNSTAGLTSRSTSRSRPPATSYRWSPTHGAPATEKTDLWIAYDADNVYVTVRCWDSQPEQRWIANEMRRDHINIVRNENVAFLFDTFFDRRNGVYFEVNAIGGFMDGTALNERSIGK